MASEVRLVQPVRASQRALWDACSTAAGLTGWYADVVSGALARGSMVRLEWPELGATVELDVVDLAQGERIVFANGESTVHLEVSEGSVSLLHEGLASDDDVEGFRSSWRVALATLTHSLEEHPGAARRTRWAVRPVRTSASLAYACFTEPSALQKWLGEDARIGQEGGHYAVRLGTGEWMSGRVLVREGGRDVALGWREQDESVLVFRTLPSPKSDEERIVAACWSKWGATQPGEQAAEHALRRALDRLGALLAMSGTA